MLIIAISKNCGASILNEKTNKIGAKSMPGYTEADYENSVIELFRNDLGYEYAK